AAVALSTTRGTLSAVTDNANGTYTSTLTSSTTVGYAAVSGTVNGSAMTSSGGVSFVAAPATKYLVTSSSPNPTDGSTATITVQLKDAAGNNVTSSGGTVTLATTRGTLSAVTDNANGTYTATLVSSTSVGTATITGALNGSALANSTAVSFVGGGASTATSTITASPGSIVADGASTSTVTLQLKDAGGNDLATSRGAVTLPTTAGSPAAVTDHGNGTYTASLTSGTSAATATISGTLSGSALANTATVTFTAGPDTTPPSFLSASVNGSTLTRVYVEALDSGSVPGGGDFT